MNCDSRPLKATCQRGAAQYENVMLKAGLPVQAVFCHCDSCRHMSGCLCITSIPLPPGDHPPTEFLSKLACFEFSKDRIFHYFCPTCGSHMVGHVFPRWENSYVEQWFVMCGTLEDTPQPYQAQHEFIADTLDGGISNYMSYANGKRIERWAQYAEKSQRLPISLPIQDISLPQDRKLHAHCKCRGVEFWVARPLKSLKYSATTCKCDSCRRSTGMDKHVIGFANIPLDQISLEEDGAIPLRSDLDFGTLKAHRYSPGINRGFCGSCRATIFIHRPNEGVLKVAVGLFSCSEGALVTDWLDWKGLTDPNAANSAP